MEEYLPLADQVNILLSARLHPSGRAYTLQEVSEATGIAAATISQMRTGRIKNPQLSTLRALSHFFNVPLRYFDTKTAEECYALLRPDEDDDPPGGITEIAFRAIALSPEAQRDILTIIQWVLAAEKSAREGGENAPPLPRLTRSEDDTNGSSS